MWPGDVPGGCLVNSGSLRSQSQGCRSLGALPSFLPRGLRLRGGAGGPVLGAWDNTAALTSFSPPVHSVTPRGPAGQHPHQVTALLPGHGGEGPLLGLRIPCTPHLLEPRGSRPAGGQQVRASGTSLGLSLLNCSKWGVAFALLSS